MKKDNEVTKALHRQINGQLLKYAAGQHIFCPSCGTVLDWKTVILIDVYKKGTQDRLAGVVCCTGCMKDFNAIDWDYLEESQNARIEVTSKEFTR